MRPLRSIAPALVALCLLAGCGQPAASPAATSEKAGGNSQAISVTPGASTSGTTNDGGTKNNAATGSLQLPAPVSLACQANQALSQEAAFQLLADLSRFDPTPSSTGEAQAYFAQWVAAEQAGWAPERGDWMNAAWTGLSIQSGVDGFRLRLKHAILVSDTPDELEQVFRVMCADGAWKVAGLQRGDTWNTPAAPLSGQDATPTPALAASMIRAAWSESAPHLRQMTTGPEQERSRVAQLLVIQGWTNHSVLWQGVTQFQTVTPDGPDAYIATGTWPDGKPSGEQLRLRKVDGVWKIENHTLGGKWLPAPDNPSGKPREPGLDLYMMGLRVGHTAQQVEQLMGKPDAVTTDGDGQVLHYAVRRVTVHLNAQGKVASLRAETGATWAGVAVGAPVQLVDLVYGPSADHTYATYDGHTLAFAIEDGKVTAITIGHK